VTIANIKIKSSYNPRGPPALEAMILANELDFNRRPIHSNKGIRNLPPGEFKAISELQKLDDKIIIKEADKGASVVVMNKKDYILEAEKQLSNRSFYQPMAEDLTPKHNKEILDYIDKMFANGELDISVVNYLHDTENKTSKFYLLPKIHKGIMPPPGRPIVAAIGSPTEKISKLVDFFINPLSVNHKSYIKDTTHFLKTLQDVGPLPANSMLVTFDVTSLYTNIPNDGGIEAANQLLTRCRSRHFKPNNASVIKLLEFVLTKNNFQFNGKHYLQVGGTSMGTRTAPSYADCYLDKFKRDFVYTYHLQPFLWKRYLDDCFCIWQHGEEELTTFLNHLNSRIDSIKFTMETSNDGVPFLDTWVKIQGEHIVTDLYCKPTDSHNYLLYSSAHPASCKNSIPYSQFLRIRRICSNITDFDTNAVKFAQYFQNRGYPLNLLETAVIKARRQDRDILLSPQKTQTQQVDNNILVTQYHPLDDNLSIIVKQNWDLLGKSHNTQFIHQNKPLVGYRRPPNLKDLFVKAEIRTKDELNASKQINRHISTAINLQFPTNTLGSLKQSQIKDFFKRSETLTTSISNINLSSMGESTPIRSGSSSSFRRTNKNLCRNFQCKICPMIDHSDTVISHVTGEKFTAKTNVTCHSSNLIYCIYCKQCGLQYVGQTLREISQRLQEHLLNIKHLCQLKRNPNYKLPASFVPHSVGLHFSGIEHNGQKDVKIKILDFVNLHPLSQKAKKIRLLVEKKWIHSLRTPSPQGMNMQD
jgi:hypothetical protein